MFPEVIADVENYISSRAKFSREKFASLAKVSDRTLYRFLAGENISRKCFLAILRVLHGSNSGEFLDALMEKYPDDPDLQKSAEFYRSKELSFDVDNDLKSFFARDRLSYKICAILLNENGTSKERIREEFGNEGAKLFEELYRKAKLKEVSPGNFRLINFKQGFADGEILRALASRLFENFEPDSFMTNESQLAHMTGFTSEKGFSLQKEILMKAVLMCIDVEKRHPGAVPYALATGLIKLIGDSDKNQIKEKLS